MSQTASYLQASETVESIEIGTLVNHIVADAIKAGASDIHIEPWETSLCVRIRLNGVLSELIHLPLDLMEKVAGRFKVMANLVTYQTGLPQEGHAPADPDLGGVELRISVFPTVRGEKIVVRIFDPSNRSFDLHALGFEEETLKTLLQLLSRPSGLILLTGPTGSGKTTSIYAALYHLVQKHGSTISIATVEDPVEFNLPMISQAQVKPAQNFTYPVALRSLMRQDPQVIMVGEIRDAETAAIAVQAGLTGHLVISTIHSGIAAGVFARLINMDIEPFLLASSIAGVLGLRLVRMNCPNCAQPYQPEPSSLAVLPAEVIESAQFSRGAGCDQCLQTGYSGRIAVTELLVVNEVVRDAILKKLPTRSLQEVITAQGMQTLWQNGLRRVIKGQTTLEEMLRVLAIDQL
ncbi:MAG: type II/IV secretion system protein [Verrucomicrobia bacterium]|nr:type II/IV secretion system protein [Verrucomicrobiota bacterium]